MNQYAHLYAAILEAESRIRPFIHQTPLEKSTVLSEKTSANVFLKCEHLQKTGSFKFRGALNKVLSLTEVEKSRGVLAASTGNHGLGVALAAQMAGIQATIYVPKDISSMKLSAIRSLGANIDKTSEDCLEAEITARNVSKQTGQIFISPYNDRDVMAGQGTIGHELFIQNPKLDAVFISVGGGGLMGGIASYLKHINPNVHIVGCWPENSPILYECLKAGKIIPVAEEPTISDATAGGLEKKSVTFDICKNVIDQSILVSEAEIYAAMRLIAETERWIIEGAAGVAVAAFFKVSHQFQGKSVAIVLCGRNISFDKFRKVIA